MRANQTLFLLLTLGYVPSFLNGSFATYTSFVKITVLIVSVSQISVVSVSPSQLVL